MGIELGWLDERVGRLAGRRRQAGPREDAPEGDVAPRVSTQHEMLLHLVYRDSSGEVSERSVLVREIFRRDAVIYLGGHCHLRNMTRVFRSDRIETLANGRTGEVIADVAEFLEALAPPADKRYAAMGYREGGGERWTTAEAAHLRQQTRPLAILMMALAKADGEWHPKEVQTLDAMLKAFVAKLALPDLVRARVLMVAEYSAIVPSSNLVTRACKALLAERDGYADAPAWCRRMIEADGRTHPDELREYRAIVGRLAELAVE